MAIKTKVGYQTGSDGNPQVAVTVWRDDYAVLSRSDAFAAATNAIDSTIDGIPVQGFSSADEVADHAWQFVANYSTTPPGSNLSRPPDPQQTNTTQRSANFTAKSKKLFNFIEPIGVYQDGGDFTDFWPHTKWKIDSFETGNFRFISEGTHFDPYPETRTITYTPELDLVTEEYLDAIEDIVSRGCFNDAEWRGRPQGSVQAVRFSAIQRNPDDWEFSFGFAYVPPRENVSVNGVITIPQMRGSWYYWTRDELFWDQDANIIENVAWLAVVGRVWDEDDFDTLELPV